MITIEKAIDFIDQEALELFLKANCYPCEMQSRPDYIDCKEKIDKLNDVAKYLRDLNKIKETFVK